MPQWNGSYTGGISVVADTADRKAHPIMGWSGLLLATLDPISSGIPTIESALNCSKKQNDLVCVHHLAKRGNDFICASINSSSAVPDTRYNQGSRHPLLELFHGWLMRQSASFPHGRASSTKQAELICLFFVVSFDTEDGALMSSHRAEAL